MATKDKNFTETKDNEVPTLSQENSRSSVYASYVPHDLKYSAEFEDAVLATVLNNDKCDGKATSVPAGLRVIPADSDEVAEEGVSVRANDIAPESLPTIAEQELPLPLDDPRRIYSSPVFGIRLTHPGGYLEGGPGLDPEMDTFPDDFLSTFAAEITSPETLRQQIEKDIKTNIEELRVRMENRRRAKEKNEQIERDMKVLTDQHSMELRIQSRMVEERKRKKEAKEKKMAGG